MRDELGTQRRLLLMSSAIFPLSFILIANGVFYYCCSVDARTRRSSGLTICRLVKLESYTRHHPLGAIFDCACSDVSGGVPPNFTRKLGSVVQTASYSYISILMNSK